MIGLPYFAACYHYYGYGEHFLVAAGVFGNTREK